MNAPSPFNVQAYHTVAQWHSTYHIILAYQSSFKRKLSKLPFVERERVTKTLQAFVIHYRYQVTRQSYLATINMLFDLSNHKRGHA